MKRDGIHPALSVGLDAGASLRIKCVTVNMWHGGQLFDNLLRFLAEQNADIVLLQEVYNGTHAGLDRQHRSLQVLQETLGYPHHDFVADYLDHDRTQGLAQRGNAILSKFPIATKKATFFHVPYSETFRNSPANAHNCPCNIQHVQLDTPQGNLHVYNIHGIYNLDGDDYDLGRQRMGEAMVKAVKGKRHVLFGGDTNARPTNKAIQGVTPYLQNVFEGQLASTYNMRRKDNPGYASSIVDMLFTDFDTKIITSSCPDVDISDHLPLVAELSFNMAEKTMTATAHELIDTILHSEQPNPAEVTL